ncbi:MAG: hypothetical protein NXY57DRAFT_962092 [Lentinula lateritia]|nr:MAG: hypothetical protein NXY57DRAFT_962092 [Lentinula lateritia]
MLSLLKPWRKVTDITEGFQSLEDAWDAFVSSCAENVLDFINNFQYFYHCSDQSAAHCAQEYQLYIAQEGSGTAGDVDQPLTLDIQERAEGSVSDAEVYEAQQKEGMAQELYPEQAGAQRELQEPRPRTGMT